MIKNLDKQMLFVNTLEISREDEIGKFSMLSLNEKLKSNFQLPIKRVTRNDEISQNIDQAFDKAILFLNVLSHMNNFIYEKTKDSIRKLNVIYDVDETYRTTCSKS